MVQVPAYENAPTPSDSFAMSGRNGKTSVDSRPGEIERRPGTGQARRLDVDPLAHDGDEHQLAHPSAATHQDPEGSPHPRLPAVGLLGDRAEPARWIRLVQVERDGHLGDEITLLWATQPASQ